MYGTRNKKPSPIFCRGRLCDKALGFRLFLLGEYRYEGTVFTAFLEVHYSVAESEEGMVFTHSHVLTGVVDSAALTNDDVASDAFLTAKYFHAQAFAFGFTTIAGTTDTFFMSHNILFLKGLTIS